MKQFILLFASIFLFIYGTKSQVEQINRIEFELKEGYDDHELAKFGKNGILIYARQDKSDAGVYKWKIERYSEDLELTKTEFFSIPKGQDLDETFENKEYLYLFFKSKQGEYTLVEIKASNLDVSTKEGKLPKNLSPSDIYIIDNTAFVTLYAKKEKAIYTIDLSSGSTNIRSIIIDGYKGSSLSIENVQIQEKSRELFVYVNAYIKKEHDIFVLRFDKNGEKKETFKLTEGVENKLSSVSASYVSKDEYIYTGTYSDHSSASSQGIYICKTKNSKREFIKFYNFLDLENFLSYLPEKKQAKIEKKKKKKELKGKELKIDYRMASHDILVKDDKFIYIGEAYYPTYRTETYTTTGANGTTVTHTRTVFDGYQYTHATIAAFSLKGEKIWDQTFKMYPYYKPYYVKKFISVSTEDKKKIDMLFASGSTIYSKSFDLNGEVLNDKSYETIETGNDEDIVKYSYTNMDYWYGKYFLAHGFQKIKNKEESLGNKKRKIYFINKIGYK